MAEAATLQLRAVWDSILQAELGKQCVGPRKALILHGIGVAVRSALYASGGQEARVLGDFEGMLRMMSTALGEERKITITEAKRALRERGAAGGRLASRLGERSKTRNGVGHPDPTLEEEILQFLARAEVFRGVASAEEKGSGTTSADERRDCLSTDSELSLPQDGAPEVVQADVAATATLKQHPAGAPPEEPIKKFALAPEATESDFARVDVAAHLRGVMPGGADSFYIGEDHGEDGFQTAALEEKDVRFSVLESQYALLQEQNEELAQEVGEVLKDRDLRFAQFERLIDQLQQEKARLVTEIAEYQQLRDDTKIGDDDNGKIGGDDNGKLLGVLGGLTAESEPSVQAGVQQKHDEEIVLQRVNEVLARFGIVGVADRLTAEDLQAAHGQRTTRPGKRRPRAPP